MRSILKQTSWLFFAQIATRIIGFFYTIFLARHLGVSEFGLFIVALAYFSIISSIADFGFNRFLIREVARDKSNAVQLLWNIVMLRLTLTSVLFAGFSVILYLLDPDKMRVSLILLATLAILPQSAALTLDGIFVGLQKLQFSAISLFLSSLSTALVGLYLVGNEFGAIGAVNALIFGQLIYFVVLLFFLKKHQILILSHIKLATLKSIIIGSFPYGLLGVLGLLYFRIDTILLSYLKGSFETGIYGVAYRFLEASLIIPIALSTALFPVFSKAEKTYKLYKRSALILVMLSFFVLAMYYVLLPSFIKIFLPNYSLSIDVIKILALSIPFFYINSLQATFLMSKERLLNHLIKISIFMIVFIVILNLFLIPKYSFIGTAWVTVISEFILVLIFFVLIKKYLH